MRVSGCGCALIDYLYNGLDFGSPAFAPFLSRRDGDGGIAPGKLVFADDLERFAGRGVEEVLAGIVGDRSPDAVNLGGPAVVALIHLAQLLRGEGEVGFYGFRGDDEAGSEASRILARTPVSADGFRIYPGISPATWVLSDPAFDGGNGERAFINAIGSAGEFGPDDLGDRFFEADILLCGGTALTPGIHDHLSEVLRRGREAGALTVVNTVYDFRSQRRDPRTRWPMGDGDAAFPLIDLLLTDREEALRLSGAADIETAGEFFLAHGVGTSVITCGAEPFLIQSDGTLFESRAAGCRFPVSGRIAAEIAAGVVEGDTTGCGDNFVGGFLYSLVRQLERRSPGELSLSEAAAWGAASGGFACRYMGGTFLEEYPGRKLEQIEPYVAAWREEYAGRASH